MSKKEEVKKKVGIRISNSSGVVMRNVYGEGPDGGIDMKNVGDLTMSNVEGRSTGKKPVESRSDWYKRPEFIVGTILAIVFTVVGILFAV